jgi:hypothetical protein
MDQVAAVSSDNEDIYADQQIMESVVKVHTELFGFTKFTHTKDFMPSFEPDYNIVTAWFRGTNTGQHLTDLSGFANVAFMHGQPLLVDGITNLGTVTDFTLSTALRFNRPDSAGENTDSVQVSDNSRLQIDDMTTGFSEFFRGKIYDTDNEEGISRTLWEKIDDSTPNYGRMMQVRDTGRLVFIVKDNGTTYAKQTPVNTIVPRAFTDVQDEIMVTYNKSTHAIVIYFNNVSQTLTDFTGEVNWHTTLTNHDLTIMHRGVGSVGSHVYGDFMDYMMYKNKVLTSTEVSRRFVNKWTIENIAFGLVAVVDHFDTH